jgi:hypothetical protein
MKYTIAESRLDKLIQNFITSQVGLLERHSSPTFGNTYIWYTDLKDVMVFEISDSSAGVGLGVLKSMWNLVKEMFSLSHYETDNAFITWMNNNKGLESPDGVYTFEN